MKYIMVIPLIAAGLCLPACLPFQPRFVPQPTTQLQARAIQTRTYDDQDPLKTLKVVLGVLQDDGYVVRFGNPELGLLTASKTLMEFDAQNYQVLAENLAGNLQPVWRQVVTQGPSGSSVTWVATLPGNLLSMEATANVSRYGHKTRVRLNVERKITTREGNLVDASPVNNAKFYQEFFAKVDKGLFIEAEGL